MVTAYRLLPLIAIMILQLGQSAAQTSLRPTDPASAAQPAWPGEPPPPASPAPPLPLTGGAVPPLPVASPLGVGGGVSPCMEEFAKLRDEVQKRGLAAKAAGQAKASREEMCKHITAYSAAELKWVKYTEANVTSCSIPTEVVQQLKQVHTNTEQTKGRICAEVRFDVPSPRFDGPDSGRPSRRLPIPRLHIAVP